MKWKRRSQGLKKTKRQINRWSYLHRTMYYSVEELVTSLSTRIGPLLQHNISLPRLRLEAYSLRAQDSCLNWYKRLPLKGDEITEIGHSRARADQSRRGALGESSRWPEEAEAEAVWLSNGGGGGGGGEEESTLYTDWRHSWLKADTQVDSSVRNV